MKCKDCSACYQVFYNDEQTISDYICYGVREPFVIYDINSDCTEYPDREEVSTTEIPDLDLSNAPKFYVDDEGIWVPEIGTSMYKQIMSKEMFVEAYNRWIKGIQPSEDVYRLNPCFVCGSTIIVEPHGETLAVQCTGCGTRLEYKGTMSALAAFWNNIKEEK